MTSRPCSRASTTSSAARRRAGFTLVELLIAVAIGGVILGAAMATAMVSQRLYQTDRARTELNQNLRTGLDLLGADIRTAGERLSPRSNVALNAVEITADGHLVLRRNIGSAPLPVCNDLRAGTRTDVVFVARRGGGGRTPPQCLFIDNDGDRWADNLEAWRDYREAHGGVLRAYIFNPSGEGEFFDYDAEDNSGFGLHRASGTWQNDYDPDNGPSIILLEETRYFLDEGALTLVRDGNAAAPERLVGDVNGFDVSVTMDDGTTHTVYDASSPYRWSRIRSVNVSLTGDEAVRGRDVTRTITSEFFPRNALSN